MKKALDIITLIAGIVGLVAFAFCAPITYICAGIILLNILVGLRTPEGAAFFVFAVFFAALGTITALITSSNVIAEICLALCMMIVILQAVGLFQYIFKR